MQNVFRLRQHYAYFAGIQVDFGSFQELGMATQPMLLRVLRGM